MGPGYSTRALASLLAPLEGRRGLVHALELRLDPALALVVDPEALAGPAAKGRLTDCIESGNGSPGAEGELKDENRRTARRGRMARTHHAAGGRPVLCALRRGLGRRAAAHLPRMRAGRRTHLRQGGARR